MRFTIASKLFFGFLCVIGLNAVYLVVVYKINDVNAIVDILKHTNDAKSLMLRLETVHRVRGTSIISFAKIGMPESVKNFHDLNERIISMIDTIQRQLDSITAIDLRLLARKEQRNQEPPVREKAREILRDFVSANDRYLAQFETLVGLRSSPSRRLSAADEKKILDSLELLDRNLAGLLSSEETILRERTAMRIKEIGSNVAEVKEIIVYILAGITLFSCIFGLIFSRTITNALRHLKESAAKIGKADFDFIPKSFANDEIGDLAKAFFDMSVDLRSKQEELFKSKKLAAIGEIVASVNHEINNPLMIISGNAQFLEMSMEGYPDDMRERVKTIIEETGRISEITRKLREIRNPVAQDYLAGSGQMIDLKKSTKG
jgi:C4-dicarboxylate-specific signal transduction histidine kinase